MKKLLTFVFTMLVGASLAFAQGTAGSSGAPASGEKTGTAASGKKGSKSGKKGHKGGKKSKKGSPSTTPPPK
jgi:hypothetical protein